MHPLYSPLGLLARWSDGLSRQIVNMIPLNWAVIALCLLGVFGTNEARQTAWDNGSAPQKISAAQFAQMAGAGANHRFVSVKGRLHPKYTLSYSGSNSGELTLMVDESGKRGFWVDNPGLSTDGAVEISGLSWQMSSDLRSDGLSSAQPRRLRAREFIAKQRHQNDVRGDIERGRSEIVEAGLMELITPWSDVTALNIV